MKKLGFGCVLLAIACGVSTVMRPYSAVSVVSVAVLEAAPPASVAVALTEAALAAEDGYGSVVGQYVLDGDVPKLSPLVKKGDASAKDPAVCAADNVPDEKLIVDEKSKGIANIFVYLKKAAKVHPDLKASKEKQVKFDQKGCRFIPHALLVRTDQDVLVLSDDPIAHNTHTSTVRNNPINQVIKASNRTGEVFKKKLPESLPSTVKCDFHPWMTAYWLILDHPYAAITDAEGKFKIDHLPAGDYEFVVWHEACGYVDKKLKAAVPSGGTADLKTIKVTAEKLLKP